MKEILTARQLLSTEQSAIVVFTRGNHFKIKPDGSGSTGNWVINSKHETENVIIYRRKADTNEIYMADFAGLIHSTEPNKKVILLRNICCVGMTSSNWFKFCRGSRRSVQFITHSAE